MKVTIPETVLSTDLHNEGVLLDLATGEYFGLDEVGMDMWRLLTTSDTVEAARAALLAQYDVAADVLARDLDELIASLAARGLVVVADA